MKNPLSQRDCPDPFVTYDCETGYYYCLYSRHTDLTLYRSRRLGEIIEKGETKRVLQADGRSGIYGCVWAPELHKIEEKWYLYSSGAVNSNGKQDFRLFVMESKTADPFEGFGEPKILEKDFTAIDPTIYRHTDGKLYVCYSRMYDEKTGEGPGLQIREMKSPTEMGARMAWVSTAEYPWEAEEPYTGKHRVNEGAFFLTQNGKLSIVYSANGCWSDHYALGLLKHTGGDLLDPASWKKQKEPIFKAGNGVMGPGHASFFKSPDGKETWIAYHGMSEWQGEKKETRIRRMFVQKISFRCGYPVIGEPMGAGEETAPPSGEEN